MSQTQLSVIKVLPVSLIVICAAIIVGMSACQSKGASAQQVIDNRKALIDKTLAKDLPVILLPENEYLTTAQQQKILTSNENLAQIYFDANTKEPLLNEVFTISPLRPADMIQELKTICGEDNCLRVEMFNYALNGTAIIVVEKNKEQIVDLAFYQGMQGDLTPRLAELAVAIALQDSSVHSEYGDGLDPNNVRMQATKTALNKTSCQRSKHLCAAPTFVKGDKALWVIVDLTNLKVAGTQWTNVGATGEAITERVVQNDFIMENYCDQAATLTRGDWKLNYNLTRSDGLKVYDIHYRGQPLVRSIKTVDWHVSYSETKEFGYSDAMGCPEFSQAAVFAITAPEVLPLVEQGDTVGFTLVQDYFSDGWPTPCSYNYRQQFHFYADGSFRPEVGSLGRGCGNDGTYRPVTRIAFYGDGHEFYTAEKEGQKKRWENENWVHENDLFQYIDQDYIAELVIDDQMAYRMQANTGQYPYSRGDNAYIYVTVQHPDRAEGEADLPTIGPCCNTDYQQGPEKFINGESLAEEAIVLWYVPEMKNDNREGQKYCWAESVLNNGIYEPVIYPCLSGPKFVRI